MPPAKGLFHRAIAQSGSAVRAVTREGAYATAREVMKVMNLEPKDVEKLQQAPPESLIAVIGKLTSAPGGLGSRTPRILCPVVDGKSLPYHPGDPAGLAVSANVPLMVGSVHDEAAWQAPKEMDETELRKRIDPICGAENTSKVLEMTRKAHPGATNVDLWVILASESFRGDGITQAGRKTALGKAPAYLYVFSWEDEERKAFHTIEIPFVFDHPEIIKRRANGSPEVEPLIKIMSDTWVTFARNGNPNHSGLPNWPAFNERDRPTMVFNTECKVVSDPTKTDRLILNSVGV
jgi:para-nitrobenzyl esterase